jgi:hypothetical protein
VGDDGRPGCGIAFAHGRDLDHCSTGAPESAGLYAVATGFQAISRDDVDNMARQFPVYDALYAFCRRQVSGG